MSSAMRSIRLSSQVSILGTQTHLSPPITHCYTIRRTYPLLSQAFLFSDPTDSEPETALLRSVMNQNLMQLYCGSHSIGISGYSVNSDMRAMLCPCLQDRYAAGLETNLSSKSCFTLNTLPKPPLPNGPISSKSFL